MGGPPKCRVYNYVCYELCTTLRNGAGILIDNGAFFIYIQEMLGPHKMKNYIDLVPGRV